MCTGKLHILLVEDNPRDADLLQETLLVLDEPIEISHVERWEQAAAQLAQEKTIDAILLDLMLPDSNGLATLERANAVAPQLPIIVLTGLDDESLGVEALRKGAQDYLMKGQESPRRLLQIVHHSIERKRMERKLRDVESQLLEAVETLEQRVAERTRELERFQEHLLTIAEDAQRHVAQDLHDDVGQELTGLALKAETLAEMLPVGQGPVHKLAGDILSAVERTRGKVRRLSRGMLPAELGEGGLYCALVNLAAWTSESSRIRCVFDCPEPDPRFDSRVALHLYRIAQEAVSNAVRHSGARCIRIRLEWENGDVCLRIQDDGEGLSTGGKPAEGMGLRTMRYRAGLIGGTLDVVLDTPDGSQIVCRVARLRQRPP